MPGQGDRAPLSGLPDQHLRARRGVGREHGRADAGAARSVALGEPTGTFELDGTTGYEEMHMTGIRNRTISPGRSRPPQSTASF